ncbi:hypothetical protein PybrP1_011772 [[Pythium] brassicae (nom. inval.)]|nr:hypothetical protein PybrP1_011772 [[Pythium] brassicae (nom. inval.)]
MGPDAQEQMSVGVGALAGSTIMLLTIPWALSVYAGRVSLDAQGRGNYVRPKGAGKAWNKLSPPGSRSLFHTGVVLFDEISSNAKTMIITSLIYLAIRNGEISLSGVLAEEVAKIKKASPDVNMALTSRGHIKHVQDIIRPFFHVYDQNRDRRMGADELQVFFRDLGEVVSREEAEKWIATLKYLIAKYELEKQGRKIEMTRIHVEQDTGIMDDDAKRAAAPGGNAANAAVAVAEPASSKNAPHLHSVASSLRSCLDGMLPDTLRNDATAFHQHLEQQKTRLQTEKNSWRFGLNYLFETLKQHKDWYARNQQFVQLKKDVKRFEAHVATIRAILSESVSKLDLEAGLRVAELEGRVGAYKVMFEVTKIVTKLSRPLVKLQILKPDESSLSIYCDTFVLDIVLAGGAGAVESASLTTVEKDQSKQFPERDDDLLRSLKLLAAGESANFMEKLVRLINRAELAVKHPSINFEQLEEDLYVKISEACSKQGITIHFKDPLNCAPVLEPPRKKMKTAADDAQASGGGAGVVGAVISGGDLGHEPAPASSANSVGGGDRTEAGRADSAEACPKDVETATPLVNGEWSGSISFMEWRDGVALHVVGYTPIVMVGVQARRLALAAMRHDAPDAAKTATEDPQEEEKYFNEFVSWVSPEGHKPITPQLHFARNHSVCSVFPVRSDLAMRQEYSLTTKEISGGLRLASFPIPLPNASSATLENVLQICGHSLFFHSVLLSAFCSRNNTFGRRIPADSEDAVNALIKVDVAAPDRITLHTGGLLGQSKQVLVEIATKMDCSLELSTKFLSTTPRASGAAAEASGVQLETAATMQKLASACHSVPLLTYYALKRALEAKSGQPSAGAATAANGEDCNGIVALDDDLSVPMKLEGEDMMLDDMGLF